MTAPVREPIDWPAIAADVAHALLDEPTSRTRTELRFGRRGSLSVRTDRGTWFDQEAGEGGGLLDLVTRERRCRTAEALDWLQAGGFVVATGERGPEGAPERRSRADPARTPCRRARILTARALRGEAVEFGRSAPGRWPRARVPGRTVGMAPGRRRRCPRPAPGRAMARGGRGGPGPGCEVARVAGGRVRRSRCSRCRPTGRG